MAKDRGSNVAADRDDAKAAKAEAEAPPVDKYVYFTREQVPEVYSLLDDLIVHHHSNDLCEARIALMWVYDVKPDRDDHVTLGKARKVSAREQQFHAHDFIIELNHEAWSKLLTPPQRRGLLDHELEHCGRTEKEDGSTSFYIRKHDVEEFRSVVKRNGIWKQDLQDFVDAAMSKGQKGLFESEKPTEELRTATVTLTAADLKKMAPVDRRTQAAGA